MPASGHYTNQSSIRGGIDLANHHLEPSVETCHWGYFDATLKPVMKVASGDVVTIDTVTGGPEHLPDPAKFHIPEAIASIHAKLKQVGPHILTGPVYVEGAKPGNVLEVRIHEVSLLQDWGFNVILPLLGTLPHDYNEPRKVNIPLDIKRNVATLSWGLELELKPFFGVMGVSPPKGWGRITSVAPQATGGNLDNKELMAGSTLYLPVFVEGGLFSCGDGHGAQGDGEVCITAIETALRGKFEFIVRDDLTFTYPRAETPTHYITMGMDPDLDQCAARREGRPVARRCLHAVQPCRRPPRHADRKRLQRRSHDDGQEEFPRLRRAS
jgi:acetamidase/formamidase